MALTNKQKIINLCKQIEGKQGEGSIYQLGSDKANKKIPRWTSGIEDLDYIIGGGIPEGRIIEIFGPESAGKTSLAYHLCSMTDLCLFIPAEGTFDAKRAKVFGNKPKQMLVYNDVTHGNDAMNKAMQFTEAGIPLIVIDSVPALIPSDEYERVLKNARTNSDKNARIGGVARLLSETMKPLQDLCELSGTTVIFINQVRDTMDAMLFGEKTHTPGGRALRHACSLRIQIARKSWIEVPNKDPKLASENAKVGLLNKIKIVKSKVSEPMGEIELPMFFDKGYVSFNDIKAVRQEIMAKNAEKFGGRKTRIEED